MIENLFVTLLKNKDSDATAPKCSKQGYSKKIPKMYRNTPMLGPLSNNVQKQPSRCILKKRYLKPMPKCDFNKIADLHPTTLLKQDTGSDGSRGILQNNFL